MRKLLDPRKSYELIDFNDTSAAIDYLKSNPGWEILGQESHREHKFGSWGDLWTKTTIYREAPAALSPEAKEEKIPLMPMANEAAVGKVFGFTFMVAPEIPDNEVHFRLDGKLVGKIVNIAAAPEEPKEE